MATTVVLEKGSARPEADAPRWHTAWLILMAAGGAELQYRARARTDLLEGGVLR